ncbi:hypothetical protein KY290_017707 [Solanum tuberosum]|uniref:Ulp1 protease family, C-terminal catalytic domain containing protein n=1 Tax=Solanum tuberosum TaxID=4113 RepID=A0ABQ7VDK3_SOLTU|nr:hypothetical protein KY290_017707 [Solanum tuberosum]
MNYVIKKIPAHPLRFGAVFNFDFAIEIKKSIKEEGVEMFKNTIFGPYLNIPKCNFQGQITKCLLLLEVQHENKDLLHVRHANETVLQFSIKDFAIVTGLKCKGNVKDFSYPGSTTSRLLQRYFPDATADFNLSKQMYRLFGMPYTLNVWTYECESSLNPEFAIKVASGIPGICNWRVVAVKPKFGTFMSSIFSENACSNIVPTPYEVDTLDLPDIQDAHTPEPSTTSVDAKKVQTKDNSGFEDFSTSPLGHLFRRSSRLRPPINQSFSMPDETPTPAANVSFVHVSSQGQKDKYVYPDIEELKQHMKDYVDNKFEYLVTLIKANHTELMNSRHKEDDQQPKDLAGKSTSCMVEVFDKEGNDGHQTSTFKFDQQPTSPIQMDFANNDQNVGNHQEMKDISELQFSSSDENIHQTAEITKHKKDDASGQMPQHFFEGTMNEDVSDKVQHNTNQYVSDSFTFDTSDSTTSGTISSETREAMDTLLAYLGILPIPAKPVSAVNPQELTVSQSFLSNSQLLTDISITAIVV